ncbi:unnamed protein product [Agarophyton chilense]
MDYVDISVVTACLEAMSINENHAGSNMKVAGIVEREQESNRSHNSGFNSITNCIRDPHGVSSLLSLMHVLKDEIIFKGRVSDVIDLIEFIAGCEKYEHVAHHFRLVRRRRK